MRNKLFSLIILFSLLSCFKTDDDTKIECQADCTIITGQFVSGNDEPIANAWVELDYKISSPPFASHTRKLKKAITDESGFYSMEFFIEDDELGEYSKGYFRFQVDLNSLDQNRYIILQNTISTDVINNITRRDTIINRSFYVPRKALIKINLNNFTPIQDGDFFGVGTLFPYGYKIDHNGFLNSGYQAGSSGYKAYSASDVNTQFENVIVAENERNIIRIAKRKNGVTTNEDIEIFIPENNSIELSYDF